MKCDVSGCTHAGNVSLERCCFQTTMSDNSEQSSVESSELETEYTGDDSDGMEIVSGHVEPFQDEPLVEPNAVEKETSMTKMVKLP